MNILIINHYAGSPHYGMEYRPYYLAREWQKLGHEVTIVAADHSHVRSENPVLSGDFEEEMHHGVRYLWVKTPDYIGNGVSRVRNMFTFTLKTEFRAKKLAETYSPDVVIASSTYPWDNYTAKKIAKHSGAQYVYEVHDLWPLSPMELGGLSKYHPFIMLMQRAENFAYKHADKVISMLPKTVDHMVSHGLKPEKWFYLPNGFVMEDWEDVVPISKEMQIFLEKQRHEHRSLVAYAGGLNMSNAMSNFIDAAALLDPQKFAVIIVGKGLQKQKLVERCQKEGLSHIYFFDPIPKKEIPSLLSYMDILYLGWNNNSLYRFGISPNKLIDYMMAGKPIIHAVNAGNDLVQEASCGISVEPDNPEAIVEAIYALVNKKDDEIDQLGKNGRDYVLKNHDYQKLAERFIQIVEK